MRTVASRWLRVEGLAVLALSLVLYGLHGRGWLLFAVLLLLPDLSLLGYLRGPRTGALAYNLFHTYTAPLLLAGAAPLADAPLLFALALVWSAHIGMDRMLGYGLKSPDSFHETHLGRIGRPPAVPSPPAAHPPGPGAAT